MRLNVIPIGYDQYCTKMNKTSFVEPDYNILHLNNSEIPGADFLKLKR